MSVSARVHMPSLGGATEWLNSEPLGPAELRGRVVLVNFWTLTCINWLRQEPYVRAWSQAYRDDGLVVIGVHTPEFSFEHDIDGVRRVTKERCIDYPVALDNDYEIWSAFANNYWPALYFVNADGVIRDDAGARLTSAPDQGGQPGNGVALRRQPSGTTGCGDALRDASTIAERVRRLRALDDDQALGLAA
jgi:thiol-disulfide isomerase/thioredoxin